MKITCWGTRGSISVGGEDVSRYGGDTISIEIRSNSGDLVIIDAGTGIRRLGNSLSAEDIASKKIHLLFTHYHLDHIIGAPFFAPIFNSKSNISVYGPVLENADSVRTVFETIIGAPYSPLSLDNTDTIKANLKFTTIGETSFQVGSLKITSIGISHTNLGGLGYKIEEGDKSFCFLTDNELNFQHKNGHTFSEYVDFCQDSDLLFHDAQFTEEEYPKYKGWGHGTIEGVVKLAKEAKIKKTAFIHYAPERTDEDIDAIYPTDGNCVKLSQGDVFEL
jgi:phosphoribosyl 1,2-cyclic phosphodiesterase